MRLWLAFGVAVPFVWLAWACSSSHSTFGDGPDSGGNVGNGSTDSGSTSGGGRGLSNSGPTGMFAGDTDGSGNVVGSGPCKGGHYNGTFAGTYTSHLTGIGIPLNVTGNVDMYLYQQGSADMTCHPAGEIPVPCNEVFTLSNGTVTGVADQQMLNDAAYGGFPYFCTLTGTLDCASRKLDDGWIQCSYCVGPLADGGMACQLLNGVLGTTGVGGHFAGPVTANYDINQLAFIMGTWNGAEALAGNDGGSPGPDGGTIWDYLSDSGYVGFNFGGLGIWNAAWQMK
jgi:hypothetical protein